MIRKFGPLIKTLRFEAKHSYFKSAISASKNRKNICQSMATKHQMYMYLNYRKEFLLDKKPPQGVTNKEIPIEALDYKCQSLLRSDLNLSESDLLTQSQAVIMDGQRYQQGEVVVVGFEDDEYVFGNIESCFFFQDTAYLLCNLLLINNFDSHFHAYLVSPGPNYKLLKIRDLLDYHPLGIYEINKTFYVPLRHYVKEIDL